MIINNILGFNTTTESRCNKIHMIRSNNKDVK